MSRVRFVAIPTAQRPEELRRAIDSYAAATAADLPIVVFHSARSALAQAEIQAVMRAAGNGSGGRLRYVGLPEKLAQAKAIKAKSGADPALLELALFQRGREAVPVGANRNAALLYGAGDGFLSADDDTVATLFAHDALSPRAPLSSTVHTGDPSDYYVPTDGVMDPWRLATGDARWPASGLVGQIETAGRRARRSVSRRRWCSPGSRETAVGGRPSGSGACLWVIWVYPPRH